MSKIPVDFSDHRGNGYTVLRKNKRLHVAFWASLKGVLAFRIRIACRDIIRFQGYPILSIWLCVS